MPILSLAPIRKELFKLYYEKDCFGLNDKADAAESFGIMLQIIHTALTENKG